MMTYGDFMEVKKLKYTIEFEYMGDQEKMEECFEYTLGFLEENVHGDLMIKSMDYKKIE